MRNVQIDLPKGSMIRERYMIEGLLGQGGSGAVYLVRDRRYKGNLFALKEVVDKNKQERQRFAFECELLKRLDHRSLPHVYRVFEDDKHMSAYMLMDYVDGPNLEQLRKQQPEKRFLLPQAMSIMAPIIDAVSYLHEQCPPIIHRDIKPANIIVPTAGDEAILVDFGIAKEYDQDSTTTAVRRCTPGFGAPEQYAHGTNPRTDIYGLGATFYTLLTGVVPTDAFYRVTQLGSKHIDPLKPVTDLAPTVPLPVANAIQRALSVDSDNRFATVQEFWQELNAHLDSEQSSVPLPYQERVTAPISLAAETALPSTGVINHAPIRKRFAFLLLLTSLAMFTLLAGMISGAADLHPTSGKGYTPPTAAPTHSNSRHTTLTQPTPTPTTQPTVSPTATPTQYPVLVGLYKGPISDKYTTPPTDSTMSLSQIRQNAATMSGYVAFGPGLIGNGNFTGTISPGNKLQFLIPSYAGLLPLFFKGQIQPDGGISGTYCSLNPQNDQCDYASGGYGDWKVSPS